jgi:oxygen-independent coproporphyrinogen III oxidase
MNQLANKYDFRVPRYTSYPTAPHFHSGVTNDVASGWLSDLDPMDPLSLYLHIPFCDSMCWFCGCYTKMVNRYEPIAAYLETLLQEIDLIADKLPTRFKAEHLHWGGGSPTMLTPQDWKRLIDRLRERFDISDSAEIAVELDPRDATEEYIKGITEAGVNRASIGVQDFHADVQEAIDRIQPFEVTKQVIDWLRQYGITSINMDLMYGLPYQMVDQVTDQVDRAVSLKPERIALFGYAHVPWMKEHQKLIREENLPDADARWEQAEMASNRLVELGYIRIGFDHFARPNDSLALALKNGSLHRNFQGYTADKAATLIGFGASAISSLPQGYWQNNLPMRAYSTAVESSQLPVARGIAISQKDLLRRKIIEHLMCDMQVDLADTCQEFAIQPEDFAKEIQNLAPYAADGICEIDGYKININEHARPFVRLIAAAFDTYLETAETASNRHSRAV